MEKDPFEKYYRESEPDKRKLGYIWQTAIGLQAVDGLKPSEYLIRTACRNIEGEISLAQAGELIDQYYREKQDRLPERTEEADRVSQNIAELLSENAFVFSPVQYLSIHRKLFLGILSHAGEIRDYNITKKEWVLDGDTVMYGNAFDLRETLDYDFEVERNFSYAGLSMTEIIRHLARFISGVWQIHVFGEGNTRTTAVFLIKYLRSFGFEAENDVFAENAWYFRNALVRANYNNLQKGIHETTEYLEMFLRNLLMGEHNELKNRFMHVRWENEKQDIELPKQDIGLAKQDIGHPKQDIDWLTSIQMMLEKANVSPKTGNHIKTLIKEFGREKIFGRGDVMEQLGITASPASSLIRKMKELGLIDTMTGFGKGKYRFNPEVHP